jgi:hypothetical protein
VTIRLTFCASVGAIVFGWGGFVMRVDAQNSSAPPLSGTTVSAEQGDNSSSDQAVQGRVEAALYAAKYSLETHVKVSVDKGYRSVERFCPQRVGPATCNGDRDQGSRRPKDHRRDTYERRPSTLG